jgi:hypothetical protein
VAGTFIKHIERARAATQTARPVEDKPLDEMSVEELSEAHRAALVRSTEAQRAVAAAARENDFQGPTTLGARLADLQRGKKHHWR